MKIAHRSKRGAVIAFTLAIAVGTWFQVTPARARHASDALGSAGALDTSFGTNGMVTTDVGTGWESIEAIAIQPDGKILAAGEVGGYPAAIGLARYGAHGALDPTFGEGGL